MILYWKKKWTKEVNSILHKNESWIQPTPPYIFYFKNSFKVNFSQFALTPLSKNRSLVCKVGMTKYS